jgi:hypothetical protein
MIRLLLLPVSLLALMSLSGCSTGTQDDESDAVSAASSTPTVEHGQTKSFAGTFVLEHEGEPVEFEFAVTQVDWEARTALWSAKLVDGLAVATDDENLPVRILPFRCPGCYRFDVFAEEGQPPLA